MFGTDVSTICAEAIFRVKSLDKENIGAFLFGKLKVLNLSAQGLVSQKSRELCGSEKPFVKARYAYSVKLVFSYVLKGIKTKITAKFRASRRLRFEDT